MGGQECHGGGEGGLDQPPKMSVVINRPGVAGAVL